MTSIRDKSVTCASFITYVDAIRTGNSFKLIKNLLVYH